MVGYAKRSSGFWKLAALIGVAALVVWSTPELKTFLMPYLGLPEAQVLVAEPPPTDYYAQLGTPCYPGPLGPTTAKEAWAFVPYRYPQDVGLDGFVWRVLQETIAQGAALGGSISFLDPVGVEDTILSLEPTPSAGALPKDEELARWGKLLGVRHLVVPVVGFETKEKPYLALFQSDATDGFLPAKFRELGRASLLPASPVNSAMAVNEMAIAVLARLGQKPKIPVELSRPLDLALPVPEKLLERLQGRGSAMARAKAGSTELAALGQDYLLLGYYLTCGGASPGLRLMARGQGLLALARAAAPQDSGIAQRQALGWLFVRHTMLAMKALEPLLGSRDPIALRLEQACKADADSLAAAPGFEILYRVAAERAQQLRVLGGNAMRLSGGGFPLCYLVAGATLEMNVADSRTLTEIWANCGDAGIAPDADPRVLIQAVTASMRGGSRAWSARLKGIQERAQKMTPQAEYPVATAVLSPLYEFRVRSALVAIPNCERSLMLAAHLGVDEGEKELGKMFESLPWDAAHYRASDRRHRRDFGPSWRRWVEGWKGREPRNPWACETLFRLDIQEGKGLPFKEGIGRNWDLGSAVLASLHDRLYNIEWRAANPAEVLEALRGHLATDPWDASVRGTYLCVLDLASPWSIVEQEIRQTRADLPRQSSVLDTEADLLAGRGRTVAAAQVLEERTARFPMEMDGWRDLFYLRAGGHHLREAYRVARKMREKLPDDLVTVEIYCKLADQLMTLGRLAEARPVVDAAREMEEWKGDTLLAMGRLLVLEGKTDEGITWFQRYDKRYQYRSWVPAQAGALLQLGKKEMAFAVVEDELKRSGNSPREPLAMLPRILLGFGEKDRGLELLRQIFPKAPRLFSEATRLINERPELACNLTTCRDAALLSRWIRVADEGHVHGVPELLSENPFPEAVDALLEGVKLPAIGVDCARRVGGIAWMDLDVATPSTPEQLAAHHAALSRWWAVARRDYLSERVE